MPKVSVIIPNYNHARYLPKRIESVLGQTFRDFEVIFLDDASTDDSLEVYQRYADDPRMRAMVNPANSGSPFRQWRKGLAEAGGDYVWIAESDDFADLTFLAKLCPVLDANPAVGLVYCQSWLVDENDQTLFENRKWTADLDQERWRHSYVNRGADEIGCYLAYKNIIPNASAVLLRRNVALAAGAIDTARKYTGDWFCWIRVLQRSDIAYIAESLNYWRQAHTASMRGTIKAVDRINEILSLLAFLKQDDLVKPETLAAAANNHYRHWLRSALSHNVPWSTHRDVVRQFSALVPKIRLLDLACAPLFAFNTLRRHQA